MNVQVLDGMMMIKRRKEEDVAGILEFDGLSSDDPELLEWVADHKARNGGKIRISRGAKGTRVMFSKDADMAFWKQRAEKSGKPR